MLLSSGVLVAIAAFLTPAHAIAIDPKLPDGVYQIHWSREPLDSKVMALTYFDTPHDVNITAVNFNGYLKIKERKPYCMQEDHRLDKVKKINTNYTRADDQLKAMNMLANWCEMATYVHSGAMVVAIYNDMLWYICNWATSHNYRSARASQRCSKGEILVVDGILDRCHPGRRSEVYLGGWDKSYGRSHRFGDICEGIDRGQRAHN